MGAMKEYVLEVTDGIIFRDEKHEKMYLELVTEFDGLLKGKRCDSYHKALAYLVTLDEEAREHVQEIFNFDEDGIRPECLSAAWQTGTSMKTIHLAFNLWNGFTGDESDSQSGCTPYEIFCCEYAVYYCQAIALRYPEYMNGKNWKKFS